MRLLPELEVLKEVPGYRVVLKAVLRSQIQLLVQQLSEQIGVETVVMTASLQDGSLTELGSSLGQGFLDCHSHVRSQFFAFCLKHHHQIVQQERVDTESYLSADDRQSAVLEIQTHPDIQASFHDISTVKTLHHVNTPQSRYIQKISSRPTHKVTTHRYRTAKQSKPQTATNVHPVSIARAVNHDLQMASDSESQTSGLNQSTRPDETHSASGYTHGPAVDNYEQLESVFKIEENSDFMVDEFTDDGVQKPILPLQAEVSFQPGDLAVPCTATLSTDGENQLMDQCKTVKMEPETDDELKSQLLGTTVSETPMSDLVPISCTDWTKDRGSGWSYTSATLGATGIDYQAEGSFEVDDQSVTSYRNHMMRTSLPEIGWMCIQYYMYRSMWDLGRGMNMPSATP